MTMGTHSGRLAVVTGAARGIGQATCRQLAERGASVVGIDIGDLSQTKAQVEATGASWTGITADVSEPDAVRGAAQVVDEAFGRCDILINNAGIYPHILFEEMSFEDWRRIQRVNLDSVFLMCRAFLPLMKKKGWGRIVNFTSQSVSMSLDGYVGYKAAKLGVVGLTRGLSTDVAQYGITVNAITPSLTRTPGTEEAGTVELLPTIAEMQAIKKIAEPDDVVGPILFLTSEDCYFVTGQTLYAEGGLVYP